MLFPFVAQENYALPLVPDPHNEGVIYIPSADLVTFATQGDRYTVLGTCDSAEVEIFSPNLSLKHEWWNVDQPVTR